MPLSARPTRSCATPWSPSHDRLHCPAAPCAPLRRSEDRGRPRAARCRTAASRRVVHAEPPALLRKPARHRADARRWPDGFPLVRSAGSLPVIERAITWWMSAPMDSRAAVLLVVIPHVLAAIIVWQLPPHH